MISILMCPRPTDKPANTKAGFVDDLANELALITSERFGLSYSILDLDDYDSIDCFGEAILEAPALPSTTPRTQLANVAIRAGSQAEPITSSSRQSQQSHKPQHQPHKTHQSHPTILDQPLTHEPQSNSSDNRIIKSIIIAKSFDQAPYAIQIQALELITAKRFLSHTTLHTTGKQFLFIPLLSTDHHHLIPHLNDRLMFSHYHHPDDGFVNLEELDESSLSTPSKAQSRSQSSTQPHRHPQSYSTTQPQSDSSSQHHHQYQHQSQPSSEPNPSSLFSNHDLTKIPPSLLTALQHYSSLTSLTPPIRRYIQDLITFIRLSRGVSSGITPRATQDFVTLTTLLAPIHGLSFVTPSIVSLAMRKIYPHRIVIAGMDRERSMQYGSEPGAVEKLLEGVTAEEVIEGVLGEVVCPR